MITKKKNTIGGRKATTKSEIVKKTINKNKTNKKVTDKTNKKVTDKTNKKVTANKAKTPSRGRKSGVRYEVKDTYSEKLTSFFTTCEENLNEVQEPLSKFIENGNKKAAKEARTILATLKKNVTDFWRIIQTAKGDMDEVKIK